MNRLLAALAAMSMLPLAAADGPALAPPRHGGIYVVAHRGVHHDIPENTLAAYRRAIELGCDFVEIDVRTTSDGELVSVHNATVDAYAPGHTGKVSEMTLDQLKQLDIGSRVGERWKEERIPTVAEILTLCKGRIGIYLDVKAADPEQLLALVHAEAMEAHCLWYGGPALQRHIQQHCPECHPMPDPGPEKLLPRVLQSFTPRVIATTYKNCSAGFVTTAHAAGAIVIADDDGPGTWTQLLEWGVDGIQTDEPEELIALLKERGVLPTR